MRLPKFLTVFLLTIFSFSFLVVANDSNNDTALIAPDGTTVTIRRDSYGVPHIKGDSQVGVVFAQGFAAAEDRLEQMDFYRKLALGRVATLFSFLIELDRETLTMFYTEEEREEIFESLPSELKAILEAYRDGVNTYVDSMEANPARYKPLQFKNRVFERWRVDHTIAIIAFLVRNFGAAGGDELDRLAELQEHGWEWLDENRPINYSGAPTTIPNGGKPVVRNWNYSGIHVRKEVIAALQARQQNLENLAAQHRVPQKLGSFAVLISPQKSSTGNVMLLGCPQMGEPNKSEPQITHEVELDCPTFHVGGMTVAGLPLVIIGHTEHHAWSFTSGVSDNIDVYIDSTQDESYGSYYHNGEWLEFEVIQDTIRSFFGEEAFTHYRTIHGPVFGDDLGNYQVYSKKMTFWKNEVGMAKAILGMIKAENFEAFEAAAKLNPMSFNLFYAGTDQKIKFWHIGRYQDRSDNIDPRLPHDGRGDEEWGGFIEFADLPQAADLAQGFFVNWNNKPVSWWNHGDNVPWRPRSELRSLTNRVDIMQNFVEPINRFSYANLKDVPKQIDSHGTYQQAIEITSNGFINENIIPPGQSGFVNLEGVKSPHFDDQWEMHTNWQFKDMEFGEATVAVGSRSNVPGEFSLSQNYPNPFNPITTINYQLPKPAFVELKIYDLNGKLIETLVNAYQRAGSHQVFWEASGLGSGTYFYQIIAGEYSSVRKSIVLK